MGRSLFLVSAFALLASNVAHAQQIQVQGANFQVASTQVSTGVCMTSATLQVSMQACSPFTPGQQWQIGSTTGLNPGQPVLVLSPYQNYQCLVAPSQPSETARMGMGQCSPGNPNQMFFTQSTASAQGTTVPVMYTQSGVCVKPCSDDPSSLCGYPTGSVAGCGPSGNPNLAVNPGSITVVSSLVVTTTIAGFATATETTFATITQTQTVLTTAFVATTQVFPQGPLTVTITSTSTPVITQGAVVTTTSTTIITDVITQFNDQLNGADNGLGNLRDAKTSKTKRKNKKIPGGDARSVGVVNPSLRMLLPNNFGSFKDRDDAMSLKEDWLNGDSGFPLWAIASLAVAVVAAALTVGSLVVLAASKLTMISHTETETSIGMTEANSTEDCSKLLQDDNESLESDEL